MLKTFKIINKEILITSVTNIYIDDPVREWQKDALANTWIGEVEFFKFYALSWRSSYNPEQCIIAIEVQWKHVLIGYLQDESQTVWCLLSKSITKKNPRVIFTGKDQVMTKS